MPQFSAIPAAFTSLAVFVATASWMFARYDDDNGTQEEELYNLVRDPDELRNVVSLKTTKAATLRNKTYLNGCDPSIVPAP